MQKQTHKQPLKSFIMKQSLSIIILLCSVTIANAQDKYGKTLNLGLGIGYYPYIVHNVPVLSANYEFDIAKNFTLAPSIGFYSYRNNYYWGNKNYPYRYYSYHERVLSLGLKGSYYFDDLVNANSKWDFYVAGSLGVAFVRARWEDGYYGDRSIYRNAYRGSTPVYLDLHLGTEYHINNKIGLFLDLSTGVSTLGVAIHH